MRKLSVTYNDETDPAHRPPGVLWPKRSPPLKAWPSSEISRHQPSRHEFCFGCCQQIFPKKIGCPRKAKVLVNPGEDSEEDENPGGTSTVIDVPLPPKAGRYEWDIAPEPVLNNVSLISVLESGPMDLDKIKPGFQWATSPWGVARRRRRAPFVFPRRRRRFYNSPSERALKQKVLVSDQDVERAQKGIKAKRIEQTEVKEARTKSLTQDELRAKSNLRRYPQEAVDRAKAAKLEDAQIEKLKQDSIRKVTKANKQRKGAIEQKFFVKTNEARHKLKMAKIVEFNMKRRQLYVKQTSQESEAKAYEKGAHWDRKASRAMHRLAEKLEKVHHKAEERWEVIGFLKAETAQLKAALVQAKAKVVQMEYKVQQAALQQKLVATKVAAGQKVSSDDMDDMSKEALNQVEQSVARAKRGLTKALVEAWKKFRANSILELKMAHLNVKGSVTDIQEKATAFLRSKWHKTDCTAKAKDVYYRKLIEEEAGNTDARGVFNKFPKCTTLESYRQTCDSDMVKTCKTVQVEKVSHSGQYTCVKRARVELTELQKVIFCPRLTDTGNSTHAETTPKACISVKKCDESSMTKDCALF